jgi:hypothetical protein
MTVQVDLLWRMAPLSSRINRRVSFPEFCTCPNLGRKCPGSTLKYSKDLKHLKLETGSPGLLPVKCMGEYPISAVKTDSLNNYAWTSLTPLSLRTKWHMKGHMSTSNQTSTYREIKQDFQLHTWLHSRTYQANSNSLEARALENDKPLSRLPTGIVYC